MRSVTAFPQASNGMRGSALLGPRLRALREQKGFSQGDMEARTGLLRCYISSVEHSHTVPSVDTLEKIALALNVPLYALFCDDSAEQSPNPRGFEQTQRHSERGPEEDRRFLRLLRRQVHNLGDRHRALLLFLARTMARMASDKKASDRR